jgi:hypothetical protein
LSACLIRSRSRTTIAGWYRRLRTRPSRSRIVRQRPANRRSRASLSASREEEPYFESYVPSRVGACDHVNIAERRSRDMESYQDCQIITMLRDVRSGILRLTLSCGTVYSGPCSIAVRCGHCLRQVLRSWFATSISHCRSSRFAWVNEGYCIAGSSVTMENRGRSLDMRSA